MRDILNCDGRADRHVRIVDACGIDDPGLGDLLLKRQDAPVQLSLIFLGGGIFGVFTEISERAGFFDATGDLVTLFAAKLLQSKLNDYNLAESQLKTAISPQNRKKIPPPAPCRKRENLKFSIKNIK